MISLIFRAPLGIGADVDVDVDVDVGVSADTGVNIGIGADADFGISVGGLSGFVVIFPLFLVVFASIAEKVPFSQA